MTDWAEVLSAMALVLVRISGLMVFAPVFSSDAIPLRIRAVFTLVVAFLVAPVVAGLPHAHAQLGVVAVAGELAVGLLFGLALSLLNEMITLAGQMMGFQFSFSLVNVMDPNARIERPLLSEIFGLLVTLTILGAGLHRTLLAAVLRTFSALPVGTVTLQPRSGLALVAMAAGIFTAALQLSAPVIAATVLAELAVALAGKLSPQLPVMALSVPLKTLAGYIALIGSLALWPRWIEGHFISLLDAGTALITAGGR
jgi:flagellar biosynthetic protein FliR